MDQKTFETRVLKLWVQSRVPLTRANLLAYTYAPRPKIDAWLDDMVREELLDVDANDDGDMIWVVRGAERPASGPATIGDLPPDPEEAKTRLERLRAEVLTDAPMVAAAPRCLPLQPSAKSIVASGLLSFLFGPFGWLYAGAYREAGPAIIVFLLLSGFLPIFSPPLLVLSALVGVAYARRYNQNGRRTPLFMSRDDPPALPEG